MRQDTNSLFNRDSLVLVIWRRFLPYIVINTEYELDINILSYDDNSEKFVVDLNLIRVHCLNHP